MGKDKRRAELDKFLAQSRELPAPKGSPTEQVIWLVLARHGSKDGAERAFRALWKRFVDVNEFRVAKASEIAAIVGRAVRGDAIRVSEEARGFLRRFHKDHHTIDFAATETMTIDQLRKYLAALPDSARELGLALFLHYCRRAEAADAEEAAPPPPEGAKPKKRNEKDLAQLVDRLRLSAALAAKGEVVAKTREALAAKGFVAAWEPGSAPEAPPMDPPPPPPERKENPAPATPPAAAPGPVPAPARGGKGAARPHTARGSKARTDNKGSSRR
ncbi:MAG TPA: hypothetical protein VFY93_10795 [Planctomycetota bacterium]|nr:hypothetical protein [Planctomycetota bacterium]